MSMGHKPSERQADLWIATTDLPESPGHVFYEKLNTLLAEADFGRYVEELCQEYYADDVGRASIPPGVYFRMLFVGYFEELDSQRGIAWRCSDSFSLRKFLGVAWNEATPDHSSLSRIRQRLPLSVHERVFAFVLRVGAQFGIADAKVVRNRQAEDLAAGWRLCFRPLLALLAACGPARSLVWRRRFGSRRVGMNEKRAVFQRAARGGRRGNR
jgi:hypothetical protein